MNFILSLYFLLSLGFELIYLQSSYLTLTGTLTIALLTSTYRFVMFQYPFVAYSYIVPYFWCTWYFVIVGFRRCWLRIWTENKWINKKWPTKKIVTIDAGWYCWYLEIFEVTDYESELTTYNSNITNGRSNMADQKLNLNINLGEIQYFGASFWHFTDYK